MTKSTNKKVSVIGAGAWGTALACAFARAGNEVILWALEPEVSKDINAHKQNTTFLKGIPLPDGIKATNDLSLACEADIIVLVPPAQFMRATCENMTEFLQDKTIPLVICSKGVEQYSLGLMSEVVLEVFPENPVAILSGPSFAEEVGEDLPTAVTLACADVDLGQQLSEDLSYDNFRIYTSDDIIGAQIGNAVKNVIAIACGIAKGRGMGNNATAAIITRGLAEMRRLGLAKGAKTETMMGLAGAGDIILTCSSTQSRNFSLGKALGEGETLKKILSNNGGVVTEGVHSAQSVIDLAKKLDVTMPICEAVHAILYKEADINEVASMLMSRPLKSED